MEFMGGGRTLEEQVEDCERTGSHALHWVLRRQVLRSIGVKEPKADAQNFIIWSCYVPFWSTTKLRDTVTLLNTLGTEYNYSDKEMCCGAPMIQDSIELEGVTEEQKKKMSAKSQEMMRHNVEIAEKAGQKIMVYAC
jgi:Fe-S oxidoreductase